jgi:hypothetical protein
MDVDEYAKHSRRPHSALPRWLALIFFAGCVGTVPQILSLSSTLAETALAHHWRMVWVGLDSSEALAFLVTAVLLYLRSTLVAITSSVAATMLWLDAWFDVLTSPHGEKLVTAAHLAFFVELPLGLLCFYVAWWALQPTRPPRDVDRDGMCDSDEPRLRGRAVNKGPVDHSSR